MIRQSVQRSLRDSHLCETWTTVDDLRARVASALLKAVQRDTSEGTPRAGWYRGPAPSLDEFARLSAEVHNLRERLAAVRPQNKAVELLRSLAVGTQLKIAGVTLNQAVFGGQYAFAGLDESQNVIALRTHVGGDTFNFPLDKLDTVYPIGAGTYRVTFQPFGS